MYLAKSYLDMPVPSAPPHSQCAPPSYEAATQWVVPKFTSTVQHMTVDGAYYYVRQANIKLEGDQKTFDANTRKVVYEKGITDSFRLTYLRDIEKMLFEICIAKYAQCRKTPDTNAAFARGNLVEMAQLCKDLK